MGGSAFVLECQVARELYEERPLPRTLIDKLLFRTRRAGVRRMSFGDATHLEFVLPQALAALPSMARAWMRAHIPSDDASARVILDEYLSVPVADVYLRGQERDGTTRTSVELIFSGCAGLAETSAAVVVHWCERWWREDRAAIERACAGSGVTLVDVFRFDGETSPIFFPLKQGGYALFTDAAAVPPSPGLPPPEGLPWLEVDEALNEQRADVDDVLPALKSLAEETFTDRRCRCVMCDPSFRRTDALSL
jgi:hypothetical protein